MANAPLMLDSLNLLNEDIGPYDIRPLFSINGSIRSVTVISGYIDIHTIDKIIDFVEEQKDLRTPPRLQIYIDYSASKYTIQSDIKEEFQRCAQRILEHCDEESGIYLVRIGNLFHSKCYLIQGNRRQKFIIGSLNATVNGLTKNEELILSGESGLETKSYLNHLASRITNDYLPKLKEKSDKISPDDKIYHYPATMRQLLMDGWLYYELREQDPFRFPLQLPEEILELNSNIHPLLPAKLVDGISVISLIEGSPTAGGLGATLPAKGIRRQSWKRYCIETCYGHWAPTFFDEEVDAVLNQRIEAHKPYFEAAMALLNKQQQPIQKAFVSFAKDLNQRIQHLHPGVSWEAYDSGRLFETWKGWYERLLKKLDNEEQFNRIISGITWAVVPDVWNDPIATEEFEASFFDSLRYYWSKSYAKNTSRLPAARIAANLGIDGDIEDEKLRRKIERWCKKHRNRSIFSDSEE